MKCLKNNIFMVLFWLLTITMVMPHGPVEAAIKCYDCHGTRTPVADYRPLDASFRNPSSGGFQGNHRTHMAAPASPASCEKCHPGSAGYTSSHRDGQLKVSPRINASPLITPYNNSTSAFLQTTTPTLSTCANVNCHFESATPTWGSAIFNSIAKCNQCHGGAAPLTATHAAHQRYSTGLMGKFSTYAACTTCHVNYASPPNFIHATSAGQRPIKVSVGNYNSGSLTYLPSQTHGAFGSCNNLYCHSPGNRDISQFDNPVTAATWGASLPSDCTGCHKGSATSFKWMSSGSHARHVDNYRIDCVRCHAATVNAGLTIKDVAKHVSGSVNVAFDSTSTAVNGKYNGSFTPVSKAPGSAYGVCSNTFCHSNGTSAATGTIPANSSPAWGSGVLACNGCHGNNNYSDFRKGFPLYTSNRPSTKANSHTAHIAFGCGICHVNTTVDGVTIASSTTHVNKSYNVDAGGGVSFTYTFNAAGGSCANISCHPATYRTARWGETACLSCHLSALGKRAAISLQFGAGNSHHIQGDVTDAKCFQCHWEANSDGTINTSYHGGSSLPDSPVDLVVYGAGSRPLSYSAGNSAVQYHYTTTVNRAGVQKITTHCLGCHSDQNNAAIPFGDARTPKQYAWDGSSVAARYSQSGTTNWGKYTSANAAKKKVTKAFSAHGNAAANQRGWNKITGVDGTILNTSGTANVQCYDCHNSHGSAAAGVTSRYSSATGRNRGAILKDTIAGKGGYIATYRPYSGGSAASKNRRSPGASICLDCHLNQAGGTNAPWGYNSTFGAAQPILGYWDAPYYKGYSTAGSEKRYQYKGISPVMGGHFGASAPLAVQPPANNQIGGLCTPCHDPHGVSPGLGTRQQYAAPLLKGTWITSPYKEDTAPANNTNLTARTEAGKEGLKYYIDQNTFASKINDTVSGSIFRNVTTSSGLCLGCHPKTSLTNGTTHTWKSKDRIHESVTGWKTADATVKHNYSCSKCHTVHTNSTLPRLMVTNCLDSKHKGRTGWAFANMTGSGWGYRTGSGPATAACSPLPLSFKDTPYDAGFGRGWCTEAWNTGGNGRGRIPGSWSGYFPADPYEFSKSQHNNNVACHEGPNGSASGLDQSWNTVTPWYPVIKLESGPGVSVNAGQTTITWSTNLPGSSIVYYGPTSGYGSTATGSSGQNHSVTFTNSASIHYQLKTVSSVDAQQFVSSDYIYDVTAPSVSAFAATTPSTSQDIPITSFTASDDNAVSGYLVTTAATPPLAGAAGWTATAPATYRVTNAGVDYILYPWVKDAAGNISTVYGSPVTVRATDISGLTPAYVSPTDGATVPLYSTLTAGGGGQYFFQVATDSNFTQGLQESGWQAGASYAPELSNGATYYWRVKVRNGSLNESAYTTPPRSFTSIVYNVYYSVGQNTSDHKTGTPVVTVAGTTATFSVPQTASNMGVGDVVTYGGNSCYISGKISQTVWSCVSATGGTPAAATNVAVSSITHAYASLSAAIAGASDANHLNTTDIVTGNYILNIPCYFDTGADTLRVAISNWTTGAKNHIRIYTPENTASEANASQRHKGKWDETKYHLDIGIAGGQAIYSYSAACLKIDGLQIKAATDGAQPLAAGIEYYSPNADGEFTLSNSILWEVNTSGSTDYRNTGLRVDNAKAKVFNNVFHGWGGYGVLNNGSTYLFNNTAVNCGTGYMSGWDSDLRAINNIAQSNATSGFAANVPYNTASDYNISDDGSAPGAHSKQYTFVSFVNATQNDFHLAPTDTVAKDAGIDLATDPALPFRTDIDGQIRPAGAGWDIGADEVSNLPFGAIAYWIMDEGSGTTTADMSGNGNTATFVNGPVWTAGKFGNGLSMTGVNEYANVPSLTWQPASFSVEFWLYPLTTADWNQQLHATNGWNAFTFHTTSDGSVYAGTDTNTRFTPSQLPAGTVALNQWQHFTYTFDNGSALFYKNGALLASKTGMTMPSAWGGFMIGSSSANSINGKIDEVVIYNRALTPTEIAGRYYAQDSSPPAISAMNPPDGATGVMADSVLTFTLSDDLAGVDWSSLSIQLAGTSGYSKSYTPAQTAIVRKMGSKSGYDVMVIPDAGFGVGESITVTVNAQDFTGKALIPPAWTFTVSAPSASPIGFWRFDEGSGAVANDSAGTNHGSISGADWTTGKLNSALLFSGNDRVNIPDSHQFNATDLTMEAWAYKNTSNSDNTRGTNNNPVISRQRAGTSVNGYEMGITFDGRPYLTFEDASINTWSKMNNAIPAASSTSSTEGRIPLGLGGSGDGKYAQAPCVIKDGSIYRMWYSGYNEYYPQGWRIYYATSPDGVTWTKYDNSVPADSDTTGTNGRIPRGASAGVGDNGGVAFPYVIRDGALYRMWYQGQDGSGTWRIYHATSPDGLTWTKTYNPVPTVSDTTGNYGRIPLGSAGTGDSSGAIIPVVIKDGSIYRMWYGGIDSSGVQRMFHAISPDGLNWTKYSYTETTAEGELLTRYNNTITPPSDTTGTYGRLPVGTAGKGDSGAARPGAVVKDGSVYKLWYGGYDGTSWRVYLATSPDGLTWTKFDNSMPAVSDGTVTNGRMTIGGSGKGDENSVNSVSVIKDGAAYRMWYSGIVNSTDTRRIFSATLDAGITASATLAPGWHLLTGTKKRSDGSLKLYADGVQVVSGSSSVPAVSSDAGLLVGDGLNGRIDEVRLYNRPITPAEVTADYNAADTVSPVISAMLPANGGAGIVANGNLSFTLSDSQSGVDWSTFRIDLTGTGFAKTYTQADTAVVIKSGTPASYNVTVVPDVNFPASTVISVAVTVKDVAGNSLVQPPWSFTTGNGTVDVFYSVGQNTSDHKNGTPTVTVSGKTATFSEAQTAQNMGVGDVITYGGSNVCYISGKVSPTVWSCVSATGGLPAAATNATVNSVAHAFSSLAAAISGVSNVSHLNTADLVSGKYVLNIPCYHDTGPEVLGAGIGMGGYSTGASNPIRIYTPVDTATEVNRSQRHAGKWTDNVYTIQSGCNDIIFVNNISFIEIAGLQFMTTGAGSPGCSGYMTALTVFQDGTGSVARIHDNILKAQAYNAAYDSLGGIYAYYASGNVGSAYIYNNIIYNFKTTNSNGFGIKNYLRGAAYNNTVYNCDTGIYAYQWNVSYARNNIVQGCTNGYGGVFGSGSDYNISDLAGDTTGGGHDKPATVVDFTDKANYDFHLAQTDTAARGAGADLTDDALLPFNTDIDGQIRPAGRAWDIGADDANSIAYSFSGLDTAIWDLQIGHAWKTDVTPVVITNNVFNSTDGGNTSRISATGGALEFYSSTDGSVGNYNYELLVLKNPAFMQGDFDVQFDYALPDGQVTTSDYNVYAEFRVYIDDNTSRRFMIQRAVVNGVNVYRANSIINGREDITDIATNELSGRLRIARTSGMISMYVWNSGAKSWVVLKEISGVPNIAPSQVFMAQFQAQKAPQFSIRAAISNVRLTARTAVVIPPSGAVSYWKLDEGSGQTAADSSGPNTATLGATGGADATDPAWTASGKSGSALVFDGVDEYASWSYAGGKPVDNFTLEAWVKVAPTTTITNEGEQNSGYNGNGQRYLFWPNNEGLSNRGAGVSVGSNIIAVYVHGDYFGSGDDLFMQPVASYSGNLGAGWNHIVVTFTGGTPRIYLNGVLVRTGLTKAQFSSGSVYAPTRLGGGAYKGLGYFLGTADGVVIYNRALTADEIVNRYSPSLLKSANIYNAFSGGSGEQPGAATPSTNGRIPTGSSGKGDYYWNQSPAVIYDNGMYRMWYAGMASSTPGYWRIYHATSPDGVNWTKSDNSPPEASDTIGSNGRIPLGTSGKGDSWHTYPSPSILKEGSAYRMWYSGSDGSNWRIYYATSPDGLNWTKYDNSILSSSDTTGTNGRIPVGSAGRGDSAGAFSPTVIKDGSVYKMWYAGLDAGGNWRIFYATSPDGLTWTKLDNSIPAALEPFDSTSPLPTTGNGRLPLGTNDSGGANTIGDWFYVRFGSVIKDGPSSYKLWYSGHNGSNWRIYYATSTDGLNWKKENNTIPAASNSTGQNGRLPLGGSGSGDQIQVVGASVLYDAANSIYRMWYTGFDGTPVRRLFAATSTDGLTWTKTDNSIPSAVSDSAAPGDRVVIRFNSETNAPAINASNIDSVLALDNGHSWKDGAGGIGGVTWSTATFTNDTLTITLSGAGGSPTIAGGDTVTLATEAIQAPGNNPITGAIRITPPYQSSCLDLYNMGYTTDGYYWLNANGKPAQTWCDMANGGWTRLNNQNSSLIKPAGLMYDSSDVITTHNIGSNGVAEVIKAVNIGVPYSQVKLYLTRTTSAVACPSFNNVSGTIDWYEWNGSTWVWHNWACTFNNWYMHGNMLDMSGLPLQIRMESAKASDGNVTFTSAWGNTPDNGIIHVTVWVK